MDDITLETIGQLIGTVGFPSLVAIILLKTLIGNFNKRLDELDKRLIQLNKSIVMVVKVLNQLTKEDLNGISPTNTSINENVKKE